MLKAINAARQSGWWSRESADFGQARHLTSLGVMVSTELCNGGGSICVTAVVTTVLTCLCDMGGGTLLDLSGWLWYSNNSKRWSRWPYVTDGVGRSNPIALQTP